MQNLDTFGLCSKTRSLTGIFHCAKQKDFVLLEGVALGRLLHGLNNRFVDAEGDGDAQQRKQQVGDHTNDAEGCQ